MSVASRDSGGTAHVLPDERAKASFSVDALQAALGVSPSGGRTAKIREFRPLFEGGVFDATMDNYLGYVELHEAKLRRTGAAMRIIRENPKLMMTHKAQKVGMADLFSTGSLGLHFGAFLPFLRTNASDEQKKAWLDGALNARYWAAYCQTELGHGSNVRGLETTATFDVEADEFVINSPTLTSMKWWPTAMYSCTHGVVFAQLIVNGASHGVFGFFMQFRGPDGVLLPGVEVGEIGPKMSSGGSIGYARFDHVRVPRFHMFAKHSEVTREGRFVAAPPRLSKFKYVGMMNIRAGMVAGASNTAARAAAIAIRYSCVRRQGFRDSKADDGLGGGQGENAVIDYRVQQYRLFKALGLAYLMRWTGGHVADFLKRVVDGVNAGQDAAADDLPELHATCAGLKAVCTSWAAAAAEDCRKCCGGQGILRSSGVADIAVGSLGGVTAEGEQIILGLQNARYLIKAAGQVKAGGGAGLAASVRYLGDAALPPSAARALVDGGDGLTDALVALLGDCARRVAADLHEDFDDATRGGASFDEALNGSAVLAYHAAECHCLYVLARNGRDALRKVGDAGARGALTRLVDLTLLQIVRERGGDFAGVVDAAGRRAVLRRINGLLAQLRPDAVALSDGFGFLDSQLKSTLGRADGNVYEAIYEEARRSPLNVPRMVGWDSLSAHLDADFLRSGMRAQRQGAKL